MIELPIYVEISVEKSKTEFLFDIEQNLHEIELNCDTVIEASSRHIPKYEGEYEITPGDDAVTLETKDLMMLDNVTINPIPSNYGKIGWNGAYLTVT